MATMYPMSEGSAEMPRKYAKRDGTIGVTPGAVKTGQNSTDCAQVISEKTRSGEDPSWGTGFGPDGEPQLGSPGAFQTGPSQPEMPPAHADFQGNYSRKGITSGADPNAGKGKM